MSKPSIQLIDHIGEGLDGSKVDHKQYIVMSDGVHVGYLPKTPGAWLARIVSMDDKDRDELIEAVNEHLGQTIGGAVIPPEPQEETDEDDEV